MTEGIKYRIILYNTTTQRIEQSVLATAGTAVTIPAVKNQTYNYYAYSYNTTADIPNPTTIYIDTPTDSDLLYDKGEISTDIPNKPIAITFNHKVAEVNIELDYDRLFGEVTNQNVVFVNDDYLTKGRLNLTNGELDNHQVYTTTTINFSEIDTENSLRRARYYVSDPSKLTSIQIQINELNGKYINNQTWTISGIPKLTTFSYTTPTIGQQLVGSIKLYRRFSQKTVLHCSRSQGYGYAAGQKASYNMLHEQRNYGTLNNSIVRFNSDVTTPFNSILVLTDNSLETNIINHKPDIIIIALDYTFDNASEITALGNFVRGGGVLFMLAGNSDVSSHQSFLREITNNNTVNVTAGTHILGSVYSFISVNDELINGAFGSVRTKPWGEDDGHSVQVTIGNSNDSKLVSYSELTPVNGQGTLVDIMMFRYTKYHMFWFGDAGFLANNQQNGISNATSVMWSPFATVNTSTAPNTADPQYNYNNYPIPKPNFGINGSYNVYNAPFFANVMSWAIACTEFYGINGSNTIPTNGMTVALRAGRL